VGWASRPSRKGGRDAHPTRTIKMVSYLILIPKVRREHLIFEKSIFYYSAIALDVAAAWCVARVHLVFEA
jgi:hypothetical protein